MHSMLFFNLCPGLMTLGSKQILNIEPIAVRSEPWLERLYIPSFARKFRILTVFWSKSCLVSRLTNKASMCCSRVPFSRFSSLHSLANAFPENGGCPENPAEALPRCIAWPPQCQGPSIQRQKGTESLDIGQYRKMHRWDPKQRNTRCCLALGWGGGMDLSAVGEQGWLLHSLLVSLARTDTLH